MENDFEFMEWGYRLIHRLDGSVLIYGYNKVYRTIKQQIDFLKWKRDTYNELLRADHIPCESDDELNRQIEELNCVSGGQYNEKMNKSLEKSGL